MTITLFIGVEPGPSDRIPDAQERILERVKLKVAHVKLKLLQERKTQPEVLCWSTETTTLWERNEQC